MKTTDAELVKTISILKSASRRNDAPIWLAVAARLDRAGRNRASVNLSLINRETSLNDCVVVPGKVLGSGKLDHAVKVGAFRFSEAARRKIAAAGGVCYSYEDIIGMNSTGSGVKLIG